MAEWITIQSSDLDRFMVGAQVNALRGAALSAGQTDPSVETLRDKANYVRARIGGRVRLSSTPLAVPPELIEHVCMLALETLCGRLPGLVLSSDQVNRIGRIYKDLELAGTESFPISVATDPVVMPADKTSGQMSIVSPGSSANSRNRMSGI